MQQVEFAPNDLDDELFSGGGSPSKLFGSTKTGNENEKKSHNPQLNVSTQPTSGVSSFENKITLAEACTPLFVSKDTIGENGLFRQQSKTNDGAKSSEVKDKNYF